MKSLIEINVKGEWVAAAEVVHHSDYRATFEYLPEYVFGDVREPVSVALPPSMDRVGFDEHGAPPCPAFLFDLVPQGLGRKYLLEQLKLPDANGSDIPLALHGAFNPIGNIRLATAVQYFNQWKEHAWQEACRGFTLEEIVQRNDEFVEHIWLHAMLAAGTTGVQGAAPKFLLTQNPDGLWFADAALPDDMARKHWIVKRPRGRQEADFAILRNEVAYHAVAKELGIRAAGECFVRNDMLFFERFDRQITGQGVTRLHQESLVSAAGIPGFPSGVSNFTLANAIAAYVTDPVQELTEFIARDFLNRMMKNTDNHGRNTSLQILPDQTVQLTPLYDFAPMFMDPEMIPRSCRWIADGKEAQGLDAILGNINIDDDARNAICTALAPFLGKLPGLAEVMEGCGVDRSIIVACESAIEAQLNLLGSHGQTPKTSRP